MASVIIGDPEIQRVLNPVAHETPGGYAGLGTLSDHQLMLMVTHPDAVRVVTPFSFLIDLPQVDHNGYTVYDHTFTLAHAVLLDVSNPTYDPATQPLRPMRFGRDVMDLAFMLTRKHGDVFYVSYDSGIELPRVVMVALIDPEVVKKENPDASVSGSIG